MSRSALRTWVIHALHLIRWFMLTWETIVCAVLLGTGIAFMVSQKLYAWLPEYLTAPYEDQRNALASMLSSVTQGGAALFAIVFAILALFAETGTRHQLPVTYVWRIGMRGWIRIVVIVGSFVLPLFVLCLQHYGGYGLTPWVLALFLLSLLVLVLFAIDQVKRTTTERFLMCATERCDQMPVEWKRHIRDMAVTAFRARDFEDLREIVVALANASPSEAQALNIMNEVAPLAREIGDEDQSGAWLFVQSTYCFAGPLHPPVYGAWRSQQLDRLSQLVDQGCDVSQLVTAARNPGFSRSADLRMDFLGFVEMLGMTLDTNNPHASRANPILQTLYQVLIEYYIWDTAEGRTTPRFVEGDAGWPANLYDLMALLESHEGPLYAGSGCRYLVVRSVSQLEDVLAAGSGRSEELRDDLAILKGRAWNRLLADIFNEVRRSAPEGTDRYAYYDEGSADWRMGTGPADFPLQVNPKPGSPHIFNHGPWVP